jgi:GTP-binding protein
MFRDSVKIQCKAGDGGNGHVSYGLQKRPMGGDGGKGGDIYIKGDRGIYDLRWYRVDNLYKAKRGGHGGKSNMTGEDGEDLILKVPLASVVINDDTGESWEVTKDGQTIKVLAGGIGGRGNYSYRGSKEYGAWDRGDDGGKAYVYNFTIKYEIQSDAILIGFPNAGKSSLINSVTNAKSKIGEYAFTTIYPVIGQMDGFTLVDLPGLIEGTHEGKGLGTNFLKHTKRTKMIIHMVSFENEDMIKAYNEMRKELNEISNKLTSLPEIIVLSKSDIVDKDTIKKVEKSFKDKFDKKAISLSILENDSVENFKKVIVEAYG